MREGAGKAKGMCGIERRRAGGEEGSERRGREGWLIYARKSTRRGEEKRKQPEDQKATKRKEPDGMKQTGARMKVRRGKERGWDRWASN
jgi:hypothetical protein